MRRASRAGTCPPRDVRDLLLRFLALFAVLDDVAFLEQDFFEHGLPLRLPARQELERHRKVLELLLLRVLHDRLRLRVMLQGDTLLVPADRFGLLFEGG